MEGMEDDQRRPRRIMSPLIGNEVSQTQAGAARCLGRSRAIDVATSR